MSDTATKKQLQPVKKPNILTKPSILPPYNVVLLDDDDHSYDYVIKMLKSIFGYAEEKGMQLAKIVDTAKRAIVYTCHKEKAELMCEQICSFGKDTTIATSAGSMTAIIEPAEKPR